MQTRRKPPAWKRVIASVVDYFVLTVFMYGLQLALAFTLSGSVQLVIYMAYNIVSEKFMGTSPGKIIFNLHVITRQGQRPGWRDACYRNIAKISATLTFYTGVVRILAPHQTQTSYDEFARCLVIEKIRAPIA